MERADIPLLIHGEVTDPDIDIFDREAVFVDRVLSGLVGRSLLIQRNTTREVRGRVNSAFFVARDTVFMVGMAAAGTGASAEETVTCAEAMPVPASSRGE